MSNVYVPGIFAIQISIRSAQSSGIASKLDPRKANKEFSNNRGEYSPIFQKNNKKSGF